VDGRRERRILSQPLLEGGVEDEHQPSSRRRLQFSNEISIQVKYRCLRCDQEISYIWSKKVGKLPKKTLTDSHPNLMSCDAGVAAKVMEG
jgi:hypothetical protein